VVELRDGNEMNQTEFNELAQKYDQQTRFMSFQHMMIETEGYKKLVEAGDEVVPFIIQLFKQKECGVNWFIVLETITCQHPLQPESVAPGWVGINVAATQLAWIEWWENKW